MFAKIRQYFCIHDWTCKANQGITPPIDEPKNLITFFEYATMYCRKCNKVSELSLKHINELKELYHNDEQKNE